MESKVASKVASKAAARLLTHLLDPQPSTRRAALKRNMSPGRGARSGPSRTRRERRRWERVQPDSTTPGGTHATAPGHGNFYTGFRPETPAKLQPSRSGELPQVSGVRSGGFTPELPVQTQPIDPLPGNSDWTLRLGGRPLDGAATHEGEEGPIDGRESSRIT